MKNWLRAHGQKTDPIEVTVRSQGMRFPRDMPFHYIAFAYLPPQRPNGN
jgi:hypothetical protein